MSPAWKTVVICRLDDCESFSDYGFHRYRYVIIIKYNTIDNSYRNVFNPQLPMASDLKSGTANKSSLGRSYCTSVNLSMAASSFGASPETYCNWPERSASEKTYTGLLPATLPFVIQLNPLTTNAIMCVEIGGVSTKTSRISFQDLLKSFFVHTRSAFFV